MKKYRIGYTQGVYDMFHVGHLNLINRAKEQCDYLIVAINSDRLVQEYKHKTPVINENNRQMIVSNIKAVDQCVIADTLDKLTMFEHLGFDAIFIGDDWKGNPRWEATSEIMKSVGVDVIFLPHTPDISSTILRPEIEKRIEEK